MFVKFHRLSVMSLLLVPTLSACNSPPMASDVQKARIDDIRYSPRTYLTHMADNGMLHDMAIADFHFVPHTAELSGTGVARLERMGTLLDAYGGTVRYETSITDDALIVKRLEHVREYLSLTGCNMSRVKTTAGLSGGRGMPARDAIDNYDRMVIPAAGQQVAPPTGFSSDGGQNVP